MHGIVASSIETLVAENHLIQLDLNLLLYVYVFPIGILLIFESNI